jgi:hypothetical protein
MTPPAAAPRRAKPWTCVLVNQLAFPGLGTVMAGRRGVGYCQATIMVAGFVLFMVWIVLGSLALMRLVQDPTTTQEDLYAAWRGTAWTGVLGLALSAAAWFWSLASSIEILREARQTPSVLPPRNN